MMIGKYINSRLRYYSDLRRYKKLERNTQNRIRMGKRYPCIKDRFSKGGIASGHYFHQDLLVARQVYAANPNKHVDVGSRVDGFVAHVASFREIEVLDIRPVENVPHSIKFRQSDIMSPLPDNMASYCDSLSCLHAIEHFGLGRYGDPIIPDGHIKGLKNLHKLLAPGGLLYLSCPIGPLRVEFNAHRVFSIKYLLEMFEDKFIVRTFSYVDDNGDLHKDIEITKEAATNNFNCTFGCGIFALEKIQ